MSEQELRYADVSSTDMPIDAVRQMLAIKDALQEGDEPIPIPLDSPLGEYLANNSQPLFKDED